MVLDLSMPAMNGVPAASSAKRLLTIPAFGHVHYFDAPQIINEALSTGVTAVDSKSEPAQLVDKIQALLEPAA
jgi:DNA-binding NarL/FixJ family response regulator